MLPPETANISVTRLSSPIRDRYRSTPRWKNIALNPPPERQRTSSSPLLGGADSSVGGAPPPLDSGGEAPGGRRFIEGAPKKLVAVEPDRSSTGSLKQSLR